MLILVIQDDAFANTRDSVQTRDTLRITEQSMSSYPLWVIAMTSLDGVSPAVGNDDIGYGFRFGAIWNSLLAEIGSHNARDDARNEHRYDYSFLLGYSISEAPLILLSGGLCRIDYVLKEKPLLSEANSQPRIEQRGISYGAACSANLIFTKFRDYFGFGLGIGVYYAWTRPVKYYAVEAIIPLLMAGIR